MVRVAADTRTTDKQSPVFFLSIWHRTDSLSFSVSFTLSLFVVFCSAWESACPLQCLSLYVTGLSLAWANKDDYSEWLLGWMAALICSMQTAGWQQHMCWWQPHTGQTLAPYNTSHCTPVSHSEVYRGWTNPQQNHDARVSICRFSGQFLRSRRCGCHKVSS